MKKLFKRLLLIFMVVAMTLPTFACAGCDSLDDYMKSGKELKKDIKSAVSSIGDLVRESKKVLGEFIGSESSSVTTTTSDKQTDYDKLVYTDYYALNGFADIVYTKPHIGQVNYGGLDKLGRPKYVIANLDYSLITTARKRGRQPINVDPVGWANNDKVVITEDDGRSYRGYFYNRSHLLADSLGGDPTVENLVTGTRTQNVGIKNQGGMAYTEIKARDFFKVPTEETLIYQVRPVYEGNELIPRYVIVDIKSSDGRLNEQVVVKNSANGFKINYKNGSYTKIN